LAFLSHKPLSPFLAANMPLPTPLRASHAFTPTQRTLATPSKLGGAKELLLRPTRAGCGQRLRTEPPALQVQPVGFGSKRERDVLKKSGAVQRGRATTPIIPLASCDIRITSSFKTTKAAAPAAAVAPVYSPRRTSTFELLRGLPTCCEELAEDSIDPTDAASDDVSNAAEPEIFSEDEDEDANADLGALSSPSTFVSGEASGLSAPTPLIETSHGCTWDLTATWPPTKPDQAAPSVAQIGAATWAAPAESPPKGGGSSSKAEPPLAATVGAALLAPLHFELPDACTLRTLWDQRDDVYRMIKFRRTSKRERLLEKLKDEAIVVIPESPCASAFSSIGSMSSSQSSSLAVARDAARAALARA